MTTQERSRQGFWQSLFGRDEKQEPQEEIPAPVVETPLQEAGPELEIAPNDPIVAYFASASGVVEPDKLALDSPALLAMKAADIKVVVPLVSQGELIGLLNLGPRLSQQEYSADDRKLLNDLATQTAPAVQVAQLVRQQQQQAQERERIEQELRVARLIQQTLLPKAVPELGGWDVAAFYRPRGRRRLLRLSRIRGRPSRDHRGGRNGQRCARRPGDGDDPHHAPRLGPTSRLARRGAKAGQRCDGPRHPAQHVRHLPLRYPQSPHRQVTLRQRRARPTLPASQGTTRRNLGAQGDGDAPWPASRHGLRGEGDRAGGRRQHPLLHRRAGRGPRPAEGDVRHPKAAGVHRGASRRSADDRLPPLRARTLHWRRMGTGGRHHPGNAPKIGGIMTAPRPSDSRGRNGTWRVLAELSVPSEPGNERRAMEEVAGAIKDVGLEGQRLERLKTAVAEATLNAMEHGNHYRAELPVLIEVSASDTQLSVKITDEGSGPPAFHSETPDIEAKLEGLQTPRGWGLFLIKNMVDDMEVTGDEHHHTVELMLHLDGQAEGGK